MVLLKNDGVLPLKGQERIAVIGNSAKTAYYQGGGSSHINPTEVDVPFNELRKRAEDNEWVFAQGYTEKDAFDQALIDEAVSIAQTAEAAILYIALPASKESEGYDRPDLMLTDQQIALIQAVSKVQPKVIVVLNSGSAISVQPWIDDVNAVLLGWMMGQAGGGAIADILLGHVNPSGKLAETFPVKLEDTPAFINFPGGAGEVRYGEGLYVGYRYYDVKKIPVQYPFGYGMSYTSFVYSNLQVPETFTDVEGLALKLDVTNTGKMAGKETIQVYVHDCQASLDRPFKELKGFAKVDLEPGETKTVSIPLDFRAFAFFHPSYRQWVTEDGDFEFLVGASAEDIRLSARSTMTSTLELPCILDEESTIREWLDDPRGKEIIRPVMEQIQSQFQEVLGGEDSAGMNFTGMFMDMPLMGILMFQQNALPMPVEEMVAGMLQRAHAS